jgi:hypothetical protein
MRFVGHIIDNKETIKAYISGLNNRVLLMLLKDGHKFKETKKLAKWQQVAETAVIKCEEKWDWRAPLKRQNWLGCRFRNSKNSQSGTR